MSCDLIFLVILSSSLTSDVTDDRELTLVKYHSRKVSANLEYFWFLKLQINLRR